jgi:ElaB/YqjD/DUF883 family membrane-anchored ribosome-binding protein
MAEKEAVTGYEQLRADIDKLRADISDLGKTLQNIVAGWGEEAKGAARRSVQTAEERAKQSVEKIAHEVEEKPITSLATAFGVGILIGLILNRRG